MVLIVSFLLLGGCNGSKNTESVNDNDTLIDSIHYPEPNPPVFERDSVLPDSV